MKPQGCGRTTNVVNWGWFTRKNGSSTFYLLLVPNRERRRVDPRDLRALPARIALATPRLHVRTVLANTCTPSHSDIIDESQCLTKTRSLLTSQLLPLSVRTALFAPGLCPRNRQGRRSCGGAGLNDIQGGVLASAGKIIAVDTVPYKLELAEQMGATHFINSAQEDPVQRII